MIIKPRKVKLRNGKTATIRTPYEEEAEELLSFAKQVYGETDYLLRYPEEVVLGVEDEVKFIKKQLSSERGLFILAETEGKITATAQFSAVAELLKCRHRAQCAVSVLKAFQGIGLGYEMMRTLMLHIHNLGYSQLELDVVSENIKAKGLYEKLGFVKTGYLPNAFKLIDGRFMGLDQMVLMLDF